MSVNEWKESTGVDNAEIIILSDPVVVHLKD